MRPELRCWQKRNVDSHFTGGLLHLSEFRVTCLESAPPKYVTAGFQGVLLRYSAGDLSPVVILRDLNDHLRLRICLPVILLAGSFHRLQRGNNSDGYWRSGPASAILEIAISLHNVKPLQGLGKLLQPANYVLLIQIRALPDEHSFDIAPVLLALRDGFLDNQILGRANDEAYAFMLDGDRPRNCLLFVRQET